MIDSHCHLADPKFEKDLHQVIDRAMKAGVEKMVTIADSIPEAKRCVEIAEEYDQVFATVGIHPHNAKDWNQSSIRELQNLAQSSKKVRAIGEIGLDYHYMNSPKEIQRAVFRDQLLLAKELGLPCVVHTREAIEDTWKIIADVKPGKIVLHCCTEKWGDPSSSADSAAAGVERFVDAGHVLSFTGIATYSSADDIRDTIKHCPIDQLMIETDAPYLAPGEHRGKRNEPAFVVEVLKLVASLKGVSIEEADRMTTRNAVEFFSLPS